MNEKENAQILNYFLCKNLSNNTINSKFKINQFKSQRNITKDTFLPKIDNPRGSLIKYFKNKSNKSISENDKDNNYFYNNICSDKIINEIEKIKRIVNKRKYLKNGNDHCLFRNVSARIKNIEINNIYNEHINQNINNYYNNIKNKGNKDAYHSILNYQDIDNLIKLCNYKNKNRRANSQLSVNSEQTNKRINIRKNLTNNNSEKKIKVIKLKSNLNPNNNEEILFERNNNNQSKYFQLGKKYCNSTNDIFLDNKTKLLSNKKLIYNDNFKNKNKNIFIFLDISKFSDFQNQYFENNITNYINKNIENKDIKKKMLKPISKNEESIIYKEKKEKYSISDYINKTKQNFQDENELSKRKVVNKNEENNNINKVKLNEYDNNNCKKEELEGNFIYQLKYIINETEEKQNFDEKLKDNNNYKNINNNEKNDNKYSTLINNKLYINNDDDEDFNYYGRKQEDNKSIGKIYGNNNDKIKNEKINFEKLNNLYLRNDDNDNINKNENKSIIDKLNENNNDNKEIHNDINEIENNLFDNPNEKSYISNTEPSLINNNDFN